MSSYKHFLHQKYSAHILPWPIIASRNTSSSNDREGLDRKEYWEPGLSSILFAQVLGEAKVNKEVDVEVIFTNPIDMELMNCVLQVEGNDLLRGILEIE